jgi:hypothetical protein
LLEFVFKAKSDLKGKFLTLLIYLKIAGLDGKFIICNDLGENKALFDERRPGGYNVKIELSGPQTPQRKGKVEREFQPYFGRIRAILNNAGVNDQLRSRFWAECEMTVTFLSNVTSIKIKKYVLMSCYLAASQSYQPV